MAGKKKQRGNRAEITGSKPELLPADELATVGIIESRIELEQLTLKGKRWKANLKVGTILPRSYHRYSIDLDLDEKPYTDRINEIQRDLDAGLSRESHSEIREANTRISEIRKELEDMRGLCERIQF